MDTEGNEATYLKFAPAVGGYEFLDDYFSRGTFYFKQGNVVTLGEMFRFVTLAKATTVRTACAATSQPLARKWNLEAYNICVLE